MKRFIFFILFAASVCLCGAEDQSEELTELRENFFAGSLTDKVEIIQSAIEKDASVNQIFTDALSFVVDYSSLLQNDSRMIKLTRMIIENSSRITEEMDLTKTLCSLFYTYRDKSVKIAVMNVIKNYKPDRLFISNVNEFALSCLNNYSSADSKTISDIIDALQKMKDLTSVSVLFEYAVDDNIPDILTQKARDAILVFSPDYKAEIVSILEKGSPEKKLVAFHIVVENDIDTDFFKAEIAEKALSNAIIYMGNSLAADPYIIKLQFEALSELRRVAWTRSSNVLVNLFKVAEKEYQAGFIDEKSFIQVMSGLVELASGEAGLLLSEYLGKINVRTENGEPYDSDLVLAVIKMLGALGDKVAFDNLLYVGYLPYDDSIIDASRIALAGLKW
ncbi:MAG: hypothetical protein K5930_04680 [Treponemataceae bacterium]|nr:hypothetical protein [Treponemataceae bacterium]